MLLQLGLYYIQGRLLHLGLLQRPIRIVNDVFFHVWEKWYVQSKVTGVWVLRHYTTTWKITAIWLA